MCMYYSVIGLVLVWNFGVCMVFFLVFYMYLLDRKGLNILVLVCDIVIILDRFN